MSAAKRMPVEVFTWTSRIAGTINTHHIHIRDELNDSRLSMLIFREMQVNDLYDLRGPRLLAREAWIDKGTILIAIPQKVRGITSTLTQRSMQSRLGKNEYRILIELPPFRVVGNFYLLGRFQIEDALWRDTGDFAPLSNAEVTCLSNPAVSFAAEELVFSVKQVKMFCSQFET